MMTSFAAGSSAFSSRNSSGLPGATNWYACAPSMHMLCLDRAIGVLDGQAFQSKESRAQGAYEIAIRGNLHLHFKPVLNGLHHPGLPGHPTDQRELRFHFNALQERPCPIRQ